MRRVEDLRSPSTRTCAHSARGAARRGADPRRRSAAIPSTMTRRTSARAARRQPRAAPAEPADRRAARAAVRRDRSAAADRAPIPGDQRLQALPSSKPAILPREPQFVEQVARAAEARIGAQGDAPGGDQLADVRGLAEQAQIRGRTPDQSRAPRSPAADAAPVQARCRAPARCSAERSRAHRGARIPPPLRRSALRRHE